MSATGWQSFIILEINLILLTTAALCAHLRVCEPYSDHRGRYHFSFHCPRLSDNKTYMYCCHRNSTAFKCCCNDTEVQSAMQLNVTASAADGFARNNYPALVGVWIYAFLVTLLLALDFLYYSALHYEPCRACLEKWGLGGRWLKRAPGRWDSLRRGGGEPPVHPIVLARHPRHCLMTEAQSSSPMPFHTAMQSRIKTM